MTCRRTWTCLLAASMLLAVADDVEAKRLKKRTVDRKFPTGWCPVPTSDQLTFQADGASAEVMITASAEYADGISVDNVFVVEEAAFAAHLREDPCGDLPSDRTYAFTAPSSQERLYEIFDLDSNGWLGRDAFLVADESAPRWPVDEGSSGSASALILPGGSIWTTVHGLRPGRTYRFGSWWHWENSDAGPAYLTFEVDTRDPSALYLSEGRFRVTAQWQTATDSGVGGAVPLTADTGYFWFFDSSNVEVVIKVLAACPVNGRFWVFASGLTNVGVDLEVTDLHTGARYTFANPQGQNFAPRFDTTAFPCP